MIALDNCASHHDFTGLTFRSQVFHKLCKTGILLKIEICHIQFQLQTINGNLAERIRYFVIVHDAASVIAALRSSKKYAINENSAMSLKLRIHCWKKS